MEPTEMAEIAATVSFRKAATIIGVHHSTIATMVHIGQLEAIPIGRRRRVTTSSLLEHLKINSRRVAAAPEQQVRGTQS